MRRRGFTLIEMMVAIVVLVVVMTIALPIMAKMHLAGNEARVIEKMRAIHRAIDSYRMQGLGSGVPNSIGDLTGADPPYLEPGFVGGPGVRLSFAQDGYLWAYLPGPAQARPVGNIIYQIRQTYTLTALPQNRGMSGQRAFFINETGDIRYDASGVPDPSDPRLE